MQKLKNSRSLTILLIGAMGVFLTACQSIYTSTQGAVPATLEYGNINSQVLTIDTPQELTSPFQNYLSARVAESEGDIEKAAKYYMAGYKQDPENYNLVVRAFSLFATAGNGQGAYEAAKIMAANDDKQPLVRLFVAFGDVLNGNYDSALTQIKALDDKPSELIQLKLVRLYLELAAGADMASIIKEAQDLSTDKGMSTYKYYYLGRLHEQNGDIDKALENYYNAYLLDPSAVQVVLSLGRLYTHMGDAQKAQDLYNAFMELNPDALLLEKAKTMLATGQNQPHPQFSAVENLSNLTFSLATILAAQGLDNTSAQFLTLTLMLSPNHDLALFARAALADKFGNFTEAKNYYQRIPKDGVTALAAKLRMAEIDFAQGKEDKAIASLKQMAQNHPNLLTIDKVLGQLYFDDEQYQKAINAFDKVLAKEGVPTLREAGFYFLRGAAYERLKQFKAAGDDMLMALKINPENPMVLNYLGYMWVDQGINLEQAYLMLVKAVSLRPNDGAIVDSLGWAYYKKGKYETAVNYLERAVRLEPTDSTIRAHLGFAYEKIGRIKEAKWHWQNALELGPDGAEDERKLRQALAQYAD